MKERTLSKINVDIFQILLGILEGDDTLDYISARTKLPKNRIRYLLSTMEKAGFIYRKEETKRWRVQADYFRLWKNAEYVAYEQGIYEEFMKIKE